MPPKSSVSGPFSKGVDSSTSPLAQPKGSVPRLSNMLLTERGALRTCDGSMIVNAFGGVPTAGRGKITCSWLFAPTGVARYFLLIAKALDLPLGLPRNLTVADGGAGGTLPASVTLYYNVTAVDGAGGETLASNEVSFVEGTTPHKVTLTWNVVPNASGYNIYRSTTSGTKVVLVGINVPVGQPQPLTATVSYTDDGTSNAAAAIPFAAPPLGAAKLTAAGVSPAQVQFVTTAAHNLALAMNIVATGVSNAAFNVSYTVFAVNSFTSFVASTTNAGVVALAAGVTSGNGTLASGASPIADTSQQTVMFACPQATGGLSYDNSSIVALWPADNLAPDGGQPGGGGGGGNSGGGGGVPTPGQQGSTPSGGLTGVVTLLPQIVQFTNQAVIALGNGYPPFIYSDARGTSTNPTTIVTITAISVDADGVVTVTVGASHGLTSSHVSGTVILTGVGNSLYNGQFVVITVPSTTQVTLRNVAAIGQGASSGGKLTVGAIPITSNFVPAFPTWVTATNYAVNTIITPTVSNNHFYKAIQGGTSGGVQPTFPTTTGGQVADGSVIWREAGLVNSAAPPPPGCAHVTVYAGSLWMWDTWVTNTSNGLDGPTCLRMSDVNNALSWNPINQAFLDKDDGTEGMGLAVFTISAQGIPPQGSLIAFKLYASYQIVGVFGSNNFAIQRVVTDMGCTAPRTIQFVPGFGIGRLAHLGVAIFDGVNDRIISEQIRPYLYPSTDADLDMSDITVADATWLPLSWGAQTANPPMYVTAIPIGNSGGALTRLLCFDLVLKGWCIVDLPFAISTLYQSRSITSNPITVMGSFSDGTLQRWQAADIQWATSAAGSSTPANVSWSFRIPTTAAKEPDMRLYCRRVVVRGQLGSNPPTTITIIPRRGGVAKAGRAVPLPASGDFSIQKAVLLTGDRFDANVSGIGWVEIEACNLHLVPKPLGVLAGWIG